MILGDDVIDAEPPAIKQMIERVQTGRRPGARASSAFRRTTISSATA